MIKTERRIAETGGVVAETDHHVDREGTGHALLVQRMTRRNPKRSLQGGTRRMNQVRIKRRRKKLMAMFQQRKSLQLQNPPNRSLLHLSKRLQSNRKNQRFLQRRSVVRGTETEGKEDTQETERVEDQEEDHQRKRKIGGAEALPESVLLVLANTHQLCANDHPVLANDQLVHARDRLVRGKGQPVLARDLLVSVSVRLVHTKGHHHLGPKYGGEHALQAQIQSLPVLDHAVVLLQETKKMILRYIAKKTPFSKSDSTDQIETHQVQKMRDKPVTSLVTIEELGLHGVDHPHVIRGLPHHPGVEEDHPLLDIVVGHPVLVDIHQAQDFIGGPQVLVVGGL